jgi:transcriptional regulator with XRE-family HTH domain
MARQRRQIRSHRSPEISFGLVLREIRALKEISQDELAEKSGYHRNYIGMLERGEKSPSLRTVFNLAATLGMTASALIAQVERRLSA